MLQSLSRSRLRTGVATLIAATAMLLPIQHASAATAECPAGGVKVKAGSSPATVTVTDGSANANVQVVVTITGTSFRIASATGATLTGANWCLKASTKIQTGSSTSGVSTITNGKGVAQKIGYVVVYGVATSAAHVTATVGPLDTDSSLCLVTITLVDGSPGEVVRVNIPVGPDNSRLDGALDVDRGWLQTTGFLNPGQYLSSGTAELYTSYQPTGVFLPIEISPQVCG
jgi:hypothetical protein